MAVLVAVLVGLEAVFTIVLDATTWIYQVGYYQERAEAFYAPSKVKLLRI